MTFSAGRLLLFTTVAVICVAPVAGMRVACWPMFRLAAGEGAVVAELEDVLEEDELEEDELEEEAGPQQQRTN